jgi:plasmid stability protein
MKKTMMYLPDEMHRYLSAEAARTGVSMAEIAREAISQYRAAHETAPAYDLNALIGILGGSDTPGEDSVRVDDVLAEYYAPGGAWERENGLADTD